MSVSMLDVRSLKARTRMFAELHHILHTLVGGGRLMEEQVCHSSPCLPLSFNLCL